MSFEHPSVLLFCHSASYLDLLLSIGGDGQLHTSLYDNRDDFNFHITNFPFLNSNIASSPAYGVFISQIIRYARASSSYECFILRAVRFSIKLLGQGSSLRKLYGRYWDLSKQYEVPLSRILHDILDDDHMQCHPPLIRHYTNIGPWTLLPNLTFYLIARGVHRSIITGAACQQRTLTPPDTWSCPTLVLASKNIWKVLKIILWTFVEIWWYFVPRIFVKRNLSPGLLWWSSLQTKEGQRHTEFHLVEFENSQTPSTTTVWPSDHRKDYRSCAWPFYSLYEPFLKHCTLTNKAVGTIWRALSKPPQRRQGPDLCPLWLLVGTPSAIRPELAFSWAEHSRPFGCR